MIYYEDNQIRIRDMLPGDARIITDGEIAQGWDQTIDKYEMRLAHQAQGISVALVAEYNGEVAGYINVYPDPAHGAFAGSGHPEIVDFGVLEKFRRNGIGSKLMDAAEQAALQTNSRVCLGIALHAGDQRMYVKRGYAFRTAAVCGGANKSASREARSSG